MLSLLTQFIKVLLDEIEKRIYNRIKPEFDLIRKEFRPREPTEYLTRNETKELLKVDLSTVHNWVVKKKLKAYGLGHRVYFKRSEVEAAIKPINH